jgi:CRISPR system Cascade subunit CasA
MLVSRMTGRDEDPVVALAAPRPDFDGALQEFLIGLLSVTLQPHDEDDWLRLWESPPTPELLQAALDALPDAFDLDGEHVRFLQDASPDDFADVTPRTIDQLLIDSPGDQGISRNTDLFVKRTRVERIGRPAAAMALLAMQTYAPAGGQGHRTSLRGGGPLTTLVEPRLGGDGNGRTGGAPLWLKLWANVETGEQLAERAAPEAPLDATALFPWMARTRSSNAKLGGGPTTPVDAHPAQAYFGLPRRIRLEFGDAGPCELTGKTDLRRITGFRTLNYGVQYEAWKHPLSPHYRKKQTDPWFPVHGQPGGVAWRDWLGLTLGDASGGLLEPAACVARFQSRGRRLGVAGYRVHAFGYDMDNMKARGWTDATVPAFSVSGASMRDLLRHVAFQFTESTGLACMALHGSVKDALFQKPDEASGDVTHVRLELWRATEGAFYSTLGSLAALAPDGDATLTALAEHRRSFLRDLSAAALSTFDRWCPDAGAGAEALRRRVLARHDLHRTLGGHGALGAKLFQALGLATVTASRPRKKREKAT